MDEVQSNEKKKKKAKRKRNVAKLFMVTERENNIIKSRVESCHAPCESDYLRKVAIDTCYYYLDLEPIDNLRKEVNYIGKNINQITKMCHEQGSVSEAQANMINENMKSIYSLMADTLDKFMKLDKAIKRE